MAKKRTMRKMGGPVWYKSWKPSKKGEGGWEVDDMVGGVLVDTSIDKKYKRTNYHVKVETFEFADGCPNQDGKELQEGDVLVLNGCGILEKHLAGVDRGTYIEVVYKGQAEITSGEWEGEMATSLEVSIEESAAQQADDSEEDDLL